MSPVTAGATTTRTSAYFVLAAYDTTPLDGEKPKGAGAYGGIMFPSRMFA